MRSFHCDCAGCTSMVKQNPTRGLVLKTQKGSRIQRHRHAEGGIGKQMGNSVWLHKQYASWLPDQEELREAKRSLPPGSQYNVIKYDPDIGYTFFNSPDFDTADEPVAGPFIKVKFDGTVERGVVNQIWHHKWLFVDDDYTGFDVDEAAERSRAWLALPDIDFARIGRKEFWEREVAPRIKRNGSSSVDSSAEFFHGSPYPFNQPRLTDGFFWLAPTGRIARWFAQRASNYTEEGYVYDVTLRPGTKILDLTDLADEDTSKLREHLSSLGLKRAHDDRYWLDVVAQFDFVEGKNRKVIQNFLSSLGYSGIACGDLVQRGDTDYRLMPFKSVGLWDVNAVTFFQEQIG